MLRWRAVTGWLAGWLGFFVFLSCPPQPRFESETYGLTEVILVLADLCYQNTAVGDINALAGCVCYVLEGLRSLHCFPPSVFIGVGLFCSRDVVSAPCSLLLWFDSCRALAHRESDMGRTLSIETEHVGKQGYTLNLTSIYTSFPCATDPSPPLPP